MAGPYENFEVLSRWKRGNTYFVCVRCHVCADDAELNGDALYEMRESKYKAGQRPCECSTVPKRNKDQYEILLRRSLDRDGFSFIGWVSGNNTGGRVLIECPTHGVLEPKAVSDVLSGRRCIHCRRELVSEVRTRSDEELNTQYIQNSMYPTGSRINRDKDNKNLFTFECGACGDTCHGLTDSSLRKGTLPCSCSRLTTRRYSYIFSISCEGKPIALKFGITSNPWARIHKQRKESGLGVYFVGVWKYDDYLSCLTAEKEVSSSINTGVLTKEQYPDGYTETTDVTNVDRISEIFEMYGGVRLSKVGSL